MDQAQIFLYLGNILYLSSYLVKGIFLLRLLSIVGGLALMGFYFLVSGGPLWEPVIWGIAFFLINAFQLIVLYKSRKPIRLTALEYELYNKLDLDIDQKQFGLLTRAGEISTDKQIQINSNQIALKLDSVEVELHNGLIYLKPETAVDKTLNIQEDSKVLLWEAKKLKKLIDSNDGIMTAWQQLLNKEVFASKTQ